MTGIPQSTVGLMSPALGEIDQYVRAFETSWVPSDEVAIEAFLPSIDNPIYSAAARELLRIDMEFRWECGRMVGIDEYRRAVPAAFRDPATLDALAFEEYRLRRERGEEPDPGEYARDYGIDVADWLSDVSPPTRRLDVSAGTGDAILDTAMTPGVAAGARDLFDAVNRAGARQISEENARLPSVGGTFLGFRLESELGRGAFGRVFLARQIELADRLVALKVTSAEAGAGGCSADESQTLARLQHTNIVPIHSIHATGSLRAVCMPYRGSTTLADIIRGLRNSPSLPASGRHIVSTLNDRKLSTVRPGSTPGAPPDSAHVPSHSASEVVATGEHGVAGPLSSGPDVSSLAKELPRTLLDRYEGETYVQSILWIGGKLADGLTHAHDCGIIHRDLKPANVLLTDDGQPMLLDFNLADNAALRGAEVAKMGGTLPYMSPEQLTAFRDGRAAVVDARSDIYSLGLMLFELLTGRPAFPTRTGPIRQVLPAMLEDRRQQPPRLTPLNPAVTPAVEAIVRRCLQSDPARRYSSARELAEDIERHQAHLPLRHTPEPSTRERLNKWAIRHPRIVSWSTAGGVAAAALVALATWAIIHGREINRLRAEKQFGELEAARNAQLVMLDSVMNSSVRADLRHAADITRTALAPYGIPENRNWQTGPLVANLPPDEQKRLAAHVGGMLRIWAEAEQRVEDGAHHRQDTLARAMQLREQAATLIGNDGAESHFFRGRELAHHHKVKQAMAEFQTAAQLAPKSFWAWMNLGNSCFELGQNREALACYGACVGLAPENDPSTNYFAYYRRGMTFLVINDFAAAQADAEFAINYLPDLQADVLRAQRPKAYLLLAEALTNSGRLPTKRADLVRADETLTKAIEFGDDLAALYFHRGEVRRLRGEQAGAQADWAKVVGLEPRNERDWTFRGLAHSRMKDSVAAVADYDHALQLNPDYYLALQNKASELSEKLGRDDEALAVQDQMVALFPDYVKARIGRGVLLARQGKRQEAHADAVASLALSHSGETLYMAANIYALTSKQEPKDAERVLPLLAAALVSGFDALKGDTDMDPIRDKPWFEPLVKAARAIKQDEAGRSRK